MNEDKMLKEFWEKFNQPDKTNKWGDDYIDGEYSEWSPQDVYDWLKSKLPTLIQESNKEAVRGFVEYIGFVAEKPTTEEVIKQYLESVKSDDKVDTTECVKKADNYIRTLSENEQYLEKKQRDEAIKRNNFTTRKDTK